MVCAVFSVKGLQIGMPECHTPYISVETGSEILQSYQGVQHSLAIYPRIMQLSAPS